MIVDVSGYGDASLYRTIDTFVFLNTEKEIGKKPKQHHTSLMSAHDAVGVW